MTATASNTELPGMVQCYYHDQTGAGLTWQDRADAMAYPICCMYPAHPPADGPLPLLFVRSSSSLGPKFEDLHWTVTAVLTGLLQPLEVINTLATWSTITNN
jgi:hypothetical protein